MLCTYILERPDLLLTVYFCVDSDSEMEIEAEHYSNGVTESSTRIMNGTYKHQEILQADDSSVGNGVAGTGHARTLHMQDFQRHTQQAVRMPFLLFISLSLVHSSP